MLSPYDECRTGAEEVTLRLQTGCLVTRHRQAARGWAAAQGAGGSVTVRVWSVLSP